MSTARPGDGVHRGALLGLGTLLLVGGVAGLLAGAGTLGHAGFRHEPVFANPVGRFFGRDGEWAWPLVGLGVLLLVLLAVRWLTVSLHSPRASELDLPAERRGGRTLVSPSAVTAALTEEIEGYHGVDSSSARWVGQPRDASLHLVITHGDDVDLVRLLDRVDTEALAHLRQALEREDIPVRVDLRAKHLSR